jgi:hypothetical protein
MTMPHRVMPSLALGSHGFHHTVSSALQVLDDIGVPPSRITLRMMGAGYPSRWVMDQDPPAGSVLAAGDTVTLSIAGLGYFHALPVGMWDRGGEREIGTFELVELFDDPIQKAAHWIRDGARLFELRPENLAACGRWISLFGLDPDAWPTDVWYDLALLLPSIQDLAATAHGIPFVLQLLLQLPVRTIEFFPTVRRLPDEDCSLIGERFSLLGVDCIVGNRVEDLAGVRIVLGPVELRQYDDYQHGGRRALLSRVLDLATSCHRQCRVSWSVLNADRGPRLGCETENARLGVNSHLGAHAAA